MSVLPELITSIEEVKRLMAKPGEDWENGQSGRS
jgi:hypothetical protein